MLDFTNRREGSLSRDNSRLSSVDVIDDLADFRNKYSPTNYVPAIHRKNDYISRSKSINDIGLPPIEKAKKKVTEVVNANMSVPPTTTTNDNSCNNDDNGNRASVADLRKKFDKTPEKISKSPINIDTSEVKLSDNKFKILDQPGLKVNGEKIPNGLKIVKKSNLPKAVVKKIPVKTEETKLEHSEPLRIIKIPGVHKELEEQSKPTLKLKTGTEKKIKVILDKKTNSTTERKSLDKQKIKPNDSNDSANVKITSDPKLTNGFGDLKKIELDSSQDAEEKDQVDAQVSAQSLSEDSSSGSVSRTNNFASYISSKNLEGGDKQSVVILENEVEARSGFVDKPLQFQKVCAARILGLNALMLLIVFSACVIFVLISLFSYLIPYLF